MSQCHTFYTGAAWQSHIYRGDHSPAAGRAAGFAVDTITPRRMMMVAFAVWIIAAAARALFVRHWVVLMLAQIIYFVAYTIQ